MWPKNLRKGADLALKSRAGERKTPSRWKPQGIYQGLKMFVAILIQQKVQSFFFCLFVCFGFPLLCYHSGESRLCDFQLCTTIHNGAPVFTLERRMLLLSPCPQTAWHTYTCFHKHQCPQAFGSSHCWFLISKGINSLSGLIYFIMQDHARACDCSEVQ